MDGDHFGLDNHSLITSCSILVSTAGLTPTSQPVVVHRSHVIKEEGQEMSKEHHVEAVKLDEKQGEKNL